jgi:hypothetical protein
MTEVLWIPVDGVRQAHTHGCPLMDEVAGEVHVEEVPEIVSRTFEVDDLGQVPLCPACLKRLDDKPAKDAKPQATSHYGIIVKKAREPAPQTRLGDPKERWNGQNVPESVVLLKKDKRGDGGHVAVAISTGDGRSWACCWPDAPASGGAARGFTWSTSVENPPELFLGRGFREWRDLGSPSVLSPKGRERVLAALRNEVRAMTKEGSAAVVHCVLERFGISAGAPGGASAEAWYASLPGVSLPLVRGPVAIDHGGQGGGGAPSSASPAEAEAMETMADAAVEAASPPMAVTRTFILATDTARVVHLMGSCPALGGNPDAVMFNDHDGWILPHEAERFAELPVCGQCLRMREASGAGDALGLFETSGQTVIVRSDGIVLKSGGFLSRDTLRFIPRQDILSLEKKGGILTAIRLSIELPGEMLDIPFSDAASQSAAFELILNVADGTGAG